MAQINRCKGLTLQAPAKINLYLKILNKRKDQYHNLSSLIQMVGLYDRLTFREARKGIRLQVDHKQLSSDRSNLVMRAAELVQQEMRSDNLSQKGVSIMLYKEIPLAAGLGGGSSDAAATLIGLNRLWSLGWSRERLAVLGSRLGSDLPFFFYGPTAWVSGKGEIVESIPPVFEGSVLLVHPEIIVSSVSVYERYEKTIGLTKERELLNINASCPDRPTIEAVLDHPYNDLERVTLHSYPALNRMKALLKELGGESVLMSGSGPTIFGLFREHRKAIAAADAIKNRGKFQVSVVPALANSPFQR